MATDTRTLMLSIHASTEVAREQLQSLVGVVGATAQQVDARLSDVEAKFAGVGQGISGAKAALLGFAGGFVGGIVQQLPGAMIAAAKNAMDYAGSLAEVSQQLGVGTDFLQDYRFGITQSGASIVQGDQALKTFNATAGRAADGNKRAANSFRAIGVEIADSSGRLKSTEQLYRETADAIAKIPDPARQAAAATALFGESGYKLLPLLRSGSAGLSAFGDAARTLGLHLSEDTIHKIESLSDKAAALKQVLTLQLAAAIGENADAIVKLGNAGVNAVRGLGDFLTQMRGVKAMIADHGLLGYLATGASTQDEMRYGTPEGRKADLEAGVRGAQQRLRAAKSGRDSANGITGPTVAALEADLANRRKLLADFLNSPEYQSGVRAGVVPAAGTGGGAVITPAASGKASGSKGSSHAGPTLGEMIDALPKVKLGFADVGEQADRVMSALDGSNRTTADIAAKMFNLADALELLKIPPLVDEEEQRRIEEFGHDLSENVGLALIYGQKLGPALVNSLKAAAAEAVSSNLFSLLTGGKGGGGGLLGGLLGGAAKILGFADGGDPPVGQWSLVGERGPELIKPRAAMTVIPNHKLPRGGKGGGTQDIRVQVDVTPSPLFVVAARAVAAEAGAGAAASAIGALGNSGIGRQ